MQITLQDSIFDIETGVSTVTLKTDLGEFTAYAKCHEKDLNHISRYCGCRYAELKAMILYTKALARVKRAEADTLRNLINDFERSSACLPQSREKTLLYRAYYRKLKEAKQEKENVKKLKNTLKNEITERDKAIALLDNLH